MKYAVPSPQLYIDFSFMLSLTSPQNCVTFLGGGMYCNEDYVLSCVHRCDIIGLLSSCYS